MKDAYFQILDFEGRISSNDVYHDLGFTDNLIETVQEILQNSGHKTDMETIEKLGFPMTVLRHNQGGLHIGSETNESRQAIIFYNHQSPEVAEIKTRAHEESHAVCYLGLRKDLEKMVDVAGIGKFCEEDFCDQMGFYVLRKKGIEIPDDLLIPYNERLRIASDRL